MNFRHLHLTLSVDWTNRASVLECGGWDTALERCCSPEINFSIKRQTSFESGVALCSPPGFKTLARFGRFAASERKL
jgi:hypothetical protein